MLIGARETELNQPLVESKDPGSSEPSHTADGRNPFRTTLETMRNHCALVCTGESSFQGFLGGAGFRPSTVWTCHQGCMIPCHLACLTWLPHVRDKSPILPYKVFRSQTLLERLQDHQKDGEEKKKKNGQNRAKSGQTLPSRIRVISVHAKMETGPAGR